MMDFKYFFDFYERSHTNPFLINTNMFTTIIITMFLMEYVYSYWLVVLYGTILLFVNTGYRMILSTLLFMYGCRKYYIPTSFVMFLSSLLIQYWSHFALNEQSTYVKKDGFLLNYISHVLFTIPSVVELFFSKIVFPSNNIVVDKVNLYEDNNANSILTWINGKNISQSKTYHVWYDDLDVDLKKCFDNLNKKVLFRLKSLTKFNTIMEIPEMNEIYVSRNKNITEESSDNVFFRKHIDGPFYLFPLCSVKRVILSLNKNENICTIFPKRDIQPTLSDGEFACFDFNRDIHYIRSRNVDNEEPRITLKLHYVEYPKGMYPIAKLMKFLNVLYDKNARNLFLYTLTPKTRFQRSVSTIVNTITNMTYYIEEYVGFNNLLISGILTFFA